jgi:hypothetical protein
MDQFINSQWPSKTVGFLHEPQDIAMNPSIRAEISHNYKDETAYLGQYTIVIEDTGFGMSEEGLRQLFSE